MDLIPPTAKGIEKPIDKQKQKQTCRKEQPIQSYTNIRNKRTESLTVSSEALLESSLLRTRPSAPWQQRSNLLGASARFLARTVYLCAQRSKSTHARILQIAHVDVEGQTQCTVGGVHSSKWRRTNFDDSDRPIALCPQPIVSTKSPV